MGPQRVLLRGARTFPTPLSAAAYAEGTAREPTEIQNLQIGLGDVCRKLPIPLYSEVAALALEGWGGGASACQSAPFPPPPVIFPRVFTCPTTISEVRGARGCSYVPTLSDPSSLCPPCRASASSSRSMSSRRSRRGTS